MGDSTTVKTWEKHGFNSSYVLNRATTMPDFAPVGKNIGRISKRLLFAPRELGFRILWEKPGRLLRRSFDPGRKMIFGDVAAALTEKSTHGTDAAASTVEHVNDVVAGISRSRTGLAGRKIREDFSTRVREVGEGVLGKVSRTPHFGPALVPRSEARPQTKMRAKAGNALVDFFTFTERLAAELGKKTLSFSLRGRLAPSIRVKPQGRDFWNHRARASFGRSVIRRISTKTAS